ncbi:MAG: hypothetical protein JWM35_1612, partial [Verrucomicrobia bacterium]|nr:hypothetical protein [Verrucomicrobiota bacterium]
MQAPRDDFEPSFIRLGQVLELPLMSMNYRVY